MNKTVESNEKRSNRIPQLEGLRFVMICIIILSHFEFLKDSSVYGAFYNTHLHNATLGVDYFFMLSGFGIFLSTKRPDCSAKSAMNFAIAKVKKIYPTYIFSLLLGCVYVLLLTDSLFKGIAKIGLFGLIDLSLFQSITGMSTFSHSLNGVCWFLSTIFICYMVCPFFLKLVDRIKSRKQCILTMLVTVLIIMLLSFITNYIVDLKLLHGRLDDLYYGHPIIRCWYLLLGMLIGTIYKGIKRKCNALCIITFIAAVLWFFFRNNLSEELGVFIRAIDLGMCILVLSTAACGEGIVIRFFSSDKMVWLGKMSMYLFLIHYPIRMTIGTIFKMNSMFGLTTEVAGVLQAFIIILLTIVFVYGWLKIQPLIMNRISSLKVFQNRI